MPINLPGHARMLGVRRCRRRGRHVRFVSGGEIARNGFLTSATLRQITYPVSGDCLLRNALGKLTYKLSSATNASFTAYNATSWPDKTGNGDNDYNAPSYMLSNAPVGDNPHCPNGVMA
jgi:hypothetical protein